MKNSLRQERLLRGGNAVPRQDLVLVLLLTLVLALAQGGCTMMGSLPGAGRPAPRPTPEPTRPAAPARPTPTRPEPVYGTSAVVDLMARARTQSAQGNHAAAGGTIERALRIEPRNPALWYNLGVNHHRLKDYVQCENACLKSLSYINSAHSLYSENWRLIAECRLQRGDRAGAQAARKRLQALEN